MISPIILLEGPDGVGKTSLASALEQKLQGALMMSSGPPATDDPVMEYLDALTSATKAAASGRPVIIDRLHIGEMVYGPLFRGSSGVSMKWARSIDALLDSVGALKVHCFLDRRRTIERLISRDGGTPDSKSGSGLAHVDAIRASYNVLLGTGGPSILDGWYMADMGRYPVQIATEIIVEWTTRSDNNRLEHGIHEV